jgi:SSS family solute:Na+ symporter
MHVIGLSFPDWLIIAIYFLFILGVGLFLKRYIKSEEDFFLAGRKNTFWVAGLSFITVNLGALELLGMTGNTVKYGMYVAHFYWVGAIPAMLFLGIFMMPFYYSSKIKSIPGYLKLRYDEKTRVLNAISFGIMTLLVSGINLYAMALVLRTFLGWNWHISMWISACTVGVYVTLSGLMSAIFIEITLFFLIWFGLFLVAILGIVDMGGIHSLFHHIPESYSKLWSTSVHADQNSMKITWAGIVLGLGFVLSFGYWTSDFLVVQRALSAKDVRAARLAPVLASFFKMALPFIVVLGGLVALALSRNPTASFSLLHEGAKVNYDSALPLLISRYYPPGLVGLGVAALLAGFTAGQAGNISAFNTVWTYDIYQAVLNKKASPVNLIWMGRIATISGILISIATAYWAKSFPTIMDYMQAIFSWVNAPLFGTILLGMFIRWITPTAAFWGLLAGTLSSVTMFLAVKFNWLSVSVITLSKVSSDMAANFWRAWWAWVICVAVTIIISFVTEKKPESELVGLVKGLTTETLGQDVVFYQKPEFWAVISLIIFIALNVYFW